MHVKADKYLKHILKGIAPMKFVRVITILALIFTPCAAFSSSIEALGSLGGYINSVAAINDSGQVVGSSMLAGNQIYHSFIYKNGLMTDLGTFNFGGQSQAIDINNAGQIVVTINTNSHLLSLIANANGTFAYKPDGYTQYGVSASLFPFSINNNGVLAGIIPGFVGYTSTAGTYTRTSNTGIVSWVSSPADTGYTVTSSRAYSINDGGQVVGIYNSDIYMNTIDWHGFLYSNDSSIELGDGVTPKDINNLGVIIGNYENGQPYLRDSLGNLITLGGNAKLNAINDENQIVGNFGVTLPGENTTTQHAFLYQNDRFIDLNSLINDPNWVLVEATDINNNGQIVGIGFHNGIKEGFLFNVPEPATMLLLGLGLVSLAGVRRKFQK